MIPPCGPLAAVTVLTQGTAPPPPHLARRPFARDRIPALSVKPLPLMVSLILPCVGVSDWSQSGIVELYTRIRRNGYHILYLSARAIGQASTTRDYLHSVNQVSTHFPESIELFTEGQASSRSHDWALAQPLSPSPGSKFDPRHTGKLRDGETSIDRRGGRGGGRGAESDDRKEA
jgi:hypothetical protein